MTLIATGDNLRNKAMLGLQAMSQEEAEREAIRQQMLRQEKAQRAQLAGTALGVGGAYAQRKYGEDISNYVSNLFASPQAPSMGISPITAPQMGQAVAATPYGGEVAAVLGTPASGTLEAGVANALTAPTGQSAFLSTGGGLSATAPAAGVASGATATGEALAATKAATSGVGVAGAGTAAAGAGGTATGTGVGATTSTAAAPAAAGAAPSLATIAAPLAIGLGAFFLLNQLFDF